MDSSENVSSTKVLPKPTISRKEAVNRLWRLGILHWKLDPNQLGIYKQIDSSKHKTHVISASRRMGKTFMLTLMANEKCLQRPNSVVKFVAPEGKMIKRDIRLIMREIYKDCPQDIRPKFNSQDNIYYFNNGSELQLAGSDNGNADSLRGGCLSGDTLIMTPEGPIPIKDLQQGDLIYGFNADGSVSITTVKHKFKTGIKEVTEIWNKNKLLGACTDEHKWLTYDSNCVFKSDRKLHGVEYEFKDINTKTKFISRALPDIPCGYTNEPHAYAIGAMIGDGTCPTKNGKTLLLSSKDDQVPNKIARILEGEVKQISEYMFKIQKYEINKRTKNLFSNIKLNYYKEWLAKENFQTKNFDWNIVDDWDRISCLELLAGLTDTDGNFYYHKSEGNLEWSYNSSNLELIKNIQKLIFKLFQFRAVIKQDTRLEKYNGSHYKLRVRSSFTSIRMCKELTPFLAKEHKRFKEEYNNIKPKEKDFATKITKGKSYFTETYDIEAGNETHLYLTADGLVTHNTSVLCIVDEAGFSNDLDYLIKSILLPTTLTTKGKIILASTPPREPGHEFATIAQDAEHKGTLIKRTVYDNPRITLEDLESIIAEYPGGKDDIQFKREYECVFLVSEKDAVIPEFTQELENEIVREWERPPFYDGYLGMDIGFKDLTAGILAYWDFRNGVLVIEDIFSLQGSSMTTDKLASVIKETEAITWKDPATQTTREPYLRVSDNNLILINDLYRLHGLKVLPTQKDNFEAALNNVRLWLQQKKIIINPKCKELILHLRNATWNKSRTQFSRSTTFGHFDFVAALIYLVRNVNTRRNPYPPGYDFRDLHKDDYFFRDNNANKENTFKEHIKKMFSSTKSFTNPKNLKINK